MVSEGGKIEENVTTINSLSQILYLNRCLITTPPNKLIYKR